MGFAGLFGAGRAVFRVNRIVQADKKVIEAIFTAKDAQRFRIATHEGERMEGEVSSGKLVPGVNIGAELVANHTQPAFFGRGKVVTRE